MKNPINDMLHPVRMRIIQALMPNQQLTVYEIEKILNDIPTATLYRHVNKLNEAGIIKIVDEQQIRGTVKKIYSLDKNKLQTPEEFSDLSDAEHMKMFTMFMTFLQMEFERYLEKSDKNFLADGVGYRYTSVYASDDEFNEWIQEFRALMAKITSNEKAEGRKKRTIANIFIPTKE